MSEHRTLASSIGKTQPHSITFEVSEELLAQAYKGDEWSDPVQFQFQERDGIWDLVMRTVES